MGIDYSYRINIMPRKKGFKHSSETKKKISEAHMGDRAYQWKGDAASYFAKHIWIKKFYGSPNYCEHCKQTDKKKYEWCSKDHKYSRKIEEYMRLCTSCHRKYDIKNNGYKSS
jgi:hypothetical protein